ncbi:periplasmic sensor signal transduction histidine kinase [Labilithrix luteola]|uniref:histidine kinase n=1 Tax=Labilithrix luteola TaxID=1391654 RepID=A0A0K1QFS3_9BACT|nr:PAS domain-containing sensor histidine kinase [Labilithrix luteola]AKV04614.1 periplasmic sensor signal transduction histidine kinase [Labilithrix luteola]
MTTSASEDNEHPRPRSLDVGDWALDALASLEDGVLIVDTKGVLVYMNPAGLRLLGREREVEVPPPTVLRKFELYASDEKTLLRLDERPLSRALAGAIVTDVPAFARHDDGGGVHLTASASPLRDADGKVHGAVCLFRDVTARRTQEALIRKSERQKMAIVDNIPDMAWLKDRDGRFLAVNQRFAEAAGRQRPEELLGLTDLELWPHDLAASYRADDEEVMRTGIHKKIEEPLVDAKGQRHWIETWKARIVGDRGEVIGTTGIARNITERKLAEEALRETNDALATRVRERTVALAHAQENLVRKERLAVLGQLAGGVAHQIRNPLAAIMNATYVLRRHLLPDQHPNVEDAIRIIHDEVRHANVIITGLLDYARVRAPDRHPTSVIELLERVLSGDWIPESVKIERAIEKVPNLEIDSDQLHGAFFNLIRNAVEAMPSGGALRVEVRLIDHEVLIAFTDSGPGISPQVRTHLFEPLHSTKPMGIGLGLVTARTFIEAHGGHIACVDVPRGARFEIRLPLANEESA